MGGLGGILGLTWWILEGDVWDIGGVAKTYGFRTVFNDFGVFWGSWMESSSHLGDNVGLCWVQDGSKMDLRGI